VIDRWDEQIRVGSRGENRVVTLGFVLVILYVGSGWFGCGMGGWNEVV
jgi:hypothetical protein